MHLKYILLLTGSSLFTTCFSILSWSLDYIHEYCYASSFPVPTLYYVVCAFDFKLQNPNISGLKQKRKLIRLWKLRKGWIMRKEQGCNGTSGKIRTRNPKSLRLLFLGTTLCSFTLAWIFPHSKKHCSNCTDYIIFRVQSSRSQGRRSLLNIHPCVN